MTSDEIARGTVKTRRTFYLPVELDAWLEHQASLMDRSVSYYLSSLLKRERDAQASQR